MKSSNEQTLKEAIEELLKTYRLQKGITETKLINSWENVAGELIAKHTEKIYVRHRKLYIKLDSPALKNELGYAKTQLITALNMSIKEEAIDDIIFI